MFFKTPKTKILITICSILLLGFILSVLKSIFEVERKMIGPTEPLVTVEQGKLKGSVEKLQDGSEYYSFKGIKYAEVPVRFAASIPVKPWHGVYNATEHGPICIQFDANLVKNIGEEDCLYLNVYTRSLDSKAKLPVMVYIHGGSYRHGSGNSDSIGPEYLLQHDVILVTFNFRLDIFGFLSLDIPEMPGNAGMKDQVAVLHWIQKNIKQLGGDPNNVTLFGQSAGSSAVTYHMQSPMSRGLFHKAIAQSGVSLCDWAQGIDMKERAFRAADYLGNYSNNVTEILDFLRHVNAKRLTLFSIRAMTDKEKLRDAVMLFAPVAEKRFEGVEPFLTEESIDALQAGNMTKIPFMIGYTTIESIHQISYGLKSAIDTNKNPQYLVPRQVAVAVTEEKEKEMGERIKNFYTDNKGFTEDGVQAMSDMLSDRLFTYNIHRFVHFYSSLSRTYLYKFNCDTELNVIKLISPFSKLKGASHGEDTAYIFYNELVEMIINNYNPKLKDIVYRITKLWTDFAKTGNPTPDNTLSEIWTPYTTSYRAYFDIDQQFKAGKDVDLARVEFWDKIYCDAELPCIANSNSESVLKNGATRILSIIIFIFIIIR